MKKVTQTIGIDVSKLTLDVFIKTTNVHKQISNDTKGFKELISWLSKQKINLEETLFCFEHTGWYCLMLSYFLYENKYRYCCINAIEIKRSMGLKRGKSDKADAWETFFVLVSKVSSSFAALVGDDRKIIDHRERRF